MSGLERTAGRSVRWLLAGLIATPLLLVAPPPHSSTPWILFHLTLLVLFGLALTMALVEGLDTPWFEQLGTTARLFASTVLAGRGGNGGGAMAAARRLVGFGFEVDVVIDREPGRLTGAAAHQATSLEAVGSRPATQLPKEPGTIVIDGLIGYGLTDAPTRRASELIEWVNESGRGVISLDVPSGIDATTGETRGSSVDPDITLTLALPKSGFRVPRARTLLLADIAVPPSLWRNHFGLDVVDLFVSGDFVDITECQLEDPPGRN